VHHVGILYDQIMMHGQRNIKLHYFLFWHFYSVLKGNSDIM